MPFADFSRGFGDQLFQPCAKIENSRGSQNGEFVATVIRRHAQDHSENRAGVHVRSVPGPHAFTISWRRFQEFGEVQAHAGAGHDAEIRECGVAPSDAGNACENVAEMIGFCDLLHLRAGSVTAMKWLPTFSGPTLTLIRSKKYCLKMLGSSVLPRFAGHDAQRPAQIQLPLQRFDLAGVGGIQHMQFREAGNFPEGQAQPLGTQAGAAHAQQQNVPELGLLYFLRQLPEADEIRDLLLRDVKPAEPIGSRPCHSKAKRPSSKAARPCCCSSSRKRSVNCRGQGWRQLWVILFRLTRAPCTLSRGVQQLLERIREKLYTVDEQLFRNFLHGNAGLAQVVHGFSRRL